MILNVIDDFINGVSSSGLGNSVTEMTLSPMAFHTLLGDVRIRYFNCEVRVDRRGHFYFIHRGVKVKCLMDKAVEEAGDNA